MRRVALAAFLLPLTRIFAWIRVEGLDRLAETPGPVVYAANHQSHMDGPVILAAMPPARRRAVAIAAAREFFGAHFHPESYPFRRRAVSSLTYYLASLLFNVFPLPQREAGARSAIRYVGELVGSGTSVLIFPEGRRTEDGRIDDVPAGNRHDRVPSPGAGRAGPDRRPRPGAASVLANGSTGSGPRGLRRTDHS